MTEHNGKENQARNEQSQNRTDRESEPLFCTEQNMSSVVVNTQHQPEDDDAHQITLVNNPSFRVNSHDVVLTNAVGNNAIIEN